MSRERLLAVENQDGDILFTIDELWESIKVLDEGSKRRCHLEQAMAHLLRFCGFTATEAGDIELWAESCDTTISEAIEAKPDEEECPHGELWSVCEATH